MTHQPFDLIGNAVRKQAKKNKEIIFGARSLKRQIGFIGLARSTTDWDVKSKTPKRSAVQLEKTLDRKTGGDNFYTKPALFPGTFKVMDRGPDRRKGTKDDFNVADYGELKRGTKFVTIDGVRYSKVSDEIKNRKKSLKDKASAFRHEKDRRDLRLIKVSRLARKF